MMLLAVVENGRATGRLLRHGSLAGDLYAGDMVTAVVSADCWRKSTVGATDDFCLATRLTKIDEPDSETLGQAAPEEVSVEEFRAALAGKLPRVVILDVRSREEMAGGVFKNAILIPLDELAARHNQLPKNREIFVHCALGGRAKMAAYELNRLGFHTRFLPLDISSPECGCPFDGR
jgi:rhodanese-related sulfurtransferase